MTAALNESLEHWDSTVSERKDVEIVIIDSASEDGGYCVSNGERIELFPRAFDGKYENPKSAFKTLVLHELAHAHLSCSDADHSESESSVLYYKITNESPSWLDSETLEKLSH